VLILQGHRAAVRCLSYSQDGRFLASGGEDETICLWDLGAGGALAATLEQLAPIQALAFVPDSQVLLAGLSDGKLAAWDLESRRPITSLACHAGGIRHVFHISDTGEGELLITSGWDGRILVHHYPTFQREGVLADVPPCTALSWEAKRRTLAMGEESGNCVLYDLDTRCIRNQFGSLIPLCTLAWSPEGRTLASGHTEGTVRLHRMPLGKGFARLEGHTWTVYALAFTPDGRTLLSGSADGTVRLWDVASERERRCYRWHNSWVTCLAVAPDGMTAAAGSDDRTVVVWDLEEN
jgi:WD40 repeat protein